MISLPCRSLTVRFQYAVLVCLLAGCSSEPATKLTGSSAAVAGFPRHREAGRFEVENCCTLQLGREARTKRPQGIDSAIYDVTGSGYRLRLVFGPYDGSQPLAGYRLLDERMVDGVMLTSFQWTERGTKPPEGRMFWLAKVGGGRIDGVNHTPWGLRVMADCVAQAACQAAQVSVESIRF